MKHLATWIFALLLGVFAFGCWDSDDTGTSTDTDTDADNDTDMDSDTDTDTDSDTDTDTDTDSDSDLLDCDGGRYDESTGLCWQHPKESEKIEWQVAINYCDNLDLAGHSDWYLIWGVMSTRGSET